MALQPMPHFDIPEIPLELVVEAKKGAHRLWSLEDLELKHPSLSITWKREEDPAHPDVKATPAQMVRDPELDVRFQLQKVRRDIEHMEAAHELGVASIIFPSFDLIHYGTGPLATAFGAKFVLREESQPAFEPAVHTPEEAARLSYPNLYKDGICPQILERIEYYNEATQGKIPIHYCDTAGPWTEATQLWHYEDIMEAIYTAPEIVHQVLAMVTDAIMEWNDIQVTRMRNFIGANLTIGPWIPRGFHSGDDTMVCVSPRILAEFYLPYNNRLSRHYGGYTYHCCMHYDFHYMTLAAKTVGFMGFETSPEYNDVGILLAAMDQRGTWGTPLGDVMKAKHGESGRRDDLPIIRRMRGHCGLILGVYGDSRQDAIDRARRLLDALEIEHR